MAARRLKLALGVAQSGAFEIDHEHRRFWCSPEFVLLVGRRMTFDQAAALPWPFFHPDDTPALLQAFSATLEEVADADLLLLVVDASDPDRDQQRAAVEAILGDLGAGKVPRLLVFNKCDLLAPEELAARREDAGPDTFFISAIDRRSTLPVMHAIETHLWERGMMERAATFTGEEP